MYKYSPKSPSINVYALDETYFLAAATRFANGFSHVYILITCIPDMISFISLTLSSVLSAVLSRKTDDFLPK